MEASYQTSQLHGTWIPRENQYSTRNPPPYGIPRGPTAPRYEPYPFEQASNNMPNAVHVQQPPAMTGNPIRPSQLGYSDGRLLPSGSSQPLYYIPVYEPPRAQAAYPQYPQAMPTGVAEQPPPQARQYPPVNDGGEAFADFLRSEMTRPGVNSGFHPPAPPRPTPAPPEDEAYDDYPRTETRPRRTVRIRERVRYEPEPRVPTRDSDEEDSDDNKYDEQSSDASDDEDRSGRETKVRLKRQARIPYRDRAGRLRTQTYPYEIDDGSLRSRKTPNSTDTPSISLTRYLDEQRIVRYHTIQIGSWAFIYLLKEIGKFTLHASGDSGSTVFKEPFVDLFHRKRALKDFLEKTTKSPDGRDAILESKMACSEAILKLLTSDFSKLNEKYDRMNSPNLPTKVSYEDLWMIYTPGTLVFQSKAGEFPSAYMVDSVSYHKYATDIDDDIPPSDPILKLCCWSVGYHNGESGYDEKFGRLSNIIHVSRFEGERPIQELDFVPERFLGSRDVKEKLIVRGRIFWELSKPVYKEVVKTQRGGRIQAEKERVMVDYAMYEKKIREQESSQSSGGGVYYPADLGPKYDQQLQNAFDYISRGPKSHGRIETPDYSTSWFTEFDSIDPASEPTELMLVLCPPKISAFSLLHKSWSEYHVEHLRPVQFQDNAWSRLVLDQEYKDVVQAMVTSYLRKSDTFQDLVPGKGAGIAILLHGPPGVGKTLTAECVAESFQKPLYMVTAGDLGTDPETLEMKLARIFDLAVRWDAILLLDEADVFLQDRDYENLTRNALVSIFLRTLEYFKGIMFLTSNRVGAFDQAFQSRIHITLGIPEFSESVRKQVWAIFIKDLGRRRHDGSAPLLTEDECKALGQEVLTHWSREPLNGRQIRNCVRSALALAQNKKERLSAKHFNTVIKFGNTFTQYMTRLQKVEADELAQVKGDRLAEMRSLVFRNGPPGSGHHGETATGH
ncbi:hypothetical protein M426DRAFT_325499 [Hypoxylon sp. CI-4A]|nr:hypothetical protein M426DRAFT_325499 [Hypoxylon sp. CI-4A]